MGFGGIRSVGAAFANAGFADDEGGLVSAVFGFGNGLAHRGNVVAVDGVNHIPAVGFESRRRVVDEPGRHFAVNRNAVVIVKRD